MRKTGTGSCADSRERNVSPFINGWHEGLLQIRESDRHSSVKRSMEEQHDSSFTNMSITRSPRREVQHHHVITILL
jgi:hypothetical protein